MYIYIKRRYNVKQSLDKNIINVLECKTKENIYVNIIYIKHIFPYYINKNLLLINSIFFNLTIGKV